MLGLWVAISDVTIALAHVPFFGLELPVAANVFPVFRWALYCGCIVVFLRNFISLWIPAIPLFPRFDAISIAVDLSIAFSNKPFLV